MRKHITLAVLVSTIATGVAVRPARCAELNGLDFVMSTDKKSYKVGEPIRVRFTWTNVGVVKLVIPDWRGPTDGVTAFGQGKDEVRDFAVYFEGTEMLPYRGGFACGIDPEVALESKTTLTRSYTISDVYSFARAGRYVLRSAYFGYAPDNQSLGHWSGQIVHPDVQIRIHE